MFVTFVLALNLVSLAGVVVGLLLKSQVVRDAIDAGYVYSSDLATDAPAIIVDRYSKAFVTAILLNKAGRISAKKVFVVSLVSSTLFNSAVFAWIWEFQPNSPLANYFGGGDTGLKLGQGFMLSVKRPAHFIYDFFVSATLLWVRRRIYQKSRWLQILVASLSAIVVLLVPAVVMVLSLMIIGTYVPDWEHTTVGFALPLGMSTIFNGPSVLLLWLTGSATFMPDMKWAQGWLIAMSALVSTSVVVFDLIGRLIALSRRATRCMASAMLAISQTDANKLFTVSLTAFAIGNGICQVFGIAMKID